MAGLNLGSGMGALGTASFGSGLMRGLDKARQHRREDEQDEMRQQQHGLQMRQGEQVYSQREQLFPEQLQSARNVNESAGLRLKGERRKEQVDQLDYDALFTLYGGTRNAASQMNQGNPMAANEHNASLLEQYGIPTTIWMPTKDGKIGRFDPNNTDKPLDTFNNFQEASAAYMQNSRDMYKQLSPTAFKKMLESEPQAVGQDWRAMGNSGYAIDAKSGRTQKVFDAEPKGAGVGVGGGGLKYSDENTMNRWVEGYYGKRDEMGQFVLTQEQKYQAVEAQERAIAMLNAKPDLTMSQAYQIAVGSVSGKMPLSKAEELARLEAEEQGIQKTIKGALGGNNPNLEYNEFIKSRSQEIVNTGQEEADYLYRQITGMTQQQAMQVPQSNAAPQAASNQPIQINSKEEFDRLPIGTQFIAPDGSVRIK